MKNLLHNISILAMLIMMMAGIQSCSDELRNVDDVQVSFTATLQSESHTRSFGKAEHVNTLIVGIFKKGVADVHTNNGGSCSYYEIDRRFFPINGTSVGMQFSLAREQTYSFLFWAYYCDGSECIYKLDDLTAIEMNLLPDPITFSGAEAADAFFATMEDITITGDCRYPVELVRPLAQINVGTTGKQVHATFTAKGAPDTFYPFTNRVSGATDFTWNFSETTTGTFSVEGIEYNYLAMGYVFAPTTATKISTELTFIEGQTSKTVEFQQMEIEANQRSNIVGNLTQQ